MVFAERLKHYRTLRGLSQTQLAKMTGIKQATISQIETGGNATSKHIFKLAEALSVPVYELDSTIPKPGSPLPQDILDVVNELMGMPDEDRQDVLASLRTTLAIVRKKTTIG